MSDALKNFLSRELDELKQNKVRAIALAICFVAVLGIWLSDDTGEEIPLNEPQVVESPPAPKSLPVTVNKSPDGVTLVLGANADELAVADPFAGEDKPKKFPPPNPPKIPTANLPPPQVPVLPPIPQPQPQEKIILTGVAISGDIKTAMFIRGKETLFLTIGDPINGRKIVDISPDTVTLSGGVRVYLQKELN